MSSIKKFRKSFLFCVGLFLAACAGNPESSEKNEVKTHTVEIIQMQFQPAEIIAHKGDIIVFINRDIVDHDVTEQTKKWASSPIPSGSSWTLTLEASQEYFCSLHPVMKGKIRLQD